MKAAVLFDSPGKLEIKDVVIDDPAAHEVIVQVGATGLCHSDLHFLEREYPLESPIVLGHEGAGTVEAVGSDVEDFKPGDHVLAFCRGFCGKCEWCLSGRQILCAQVGLRRGRPGEAPRLRLPDGRDLLQHAGLSSFAEQMLVHENNLVKIDPAIPFDVAALVGCGVPTGVGAVIRRAKVHAGASVAVIGCGGIGLNAIQGAVLAGAERIIGIDINDGKLELARQFGATDLINNINGDAVQQLHELLPGSNGVDYSFEAIGYPETYQLAFEVLRPRGTATLMGVGQGTVSLPMAAFLDERVVQGCIMGSVNFRQDLPYLLNLYTAGRLDLDRLVSKRLPLDQINEGYAAITSGEVARSVVVFD